MKIPCSQKYASKRTNCCYRVGKTAATESKQFVREEEFFLAKISKILTGQSQKVR